MEHNRTPTRLETGFELPQSASCLASHKRRLPSEQRARSGSEYFMSELSSHNPDIIALLLNPVRITLLPHRLIFLLTSCNG